MQFLAQSMDPSFMQMVTHALLAVVEAFIRVATATFNGLEQGLRNGLDTLHIGGDLQTLIVILVPLLILAFVLKVMGGFLRVAVTLVLLILLIHILAPVADRIIHGG